MRYCKIENNIIGYPKSLPTKYKNIINGFDRLSELELNNHGFFKYVDPEYDSNTEATGILIRIDNYITKKVIDFNFRDINEEEGNRILTETDWSMISDVVPYRLTQEKQDEYKIFRMDVYSMKNLDSKQDWTGMETRMYNI